MALARSRRPSGSVDERGQAEHGDHLHIGDDRKITSWRVARRKVMCQPQRTEDHSQRRSQGSPVSDRRPQLRQRLRLQVAACIVFLLAGIVLLFLTSGAVLNIVALALIGGGAGGGWISFMRLRNET